MPWTTISPWRPVAGTGQNIAIGATSTASTNAVGPNTQAVFVSATGNCHLRIAPNPTAVATDMLIKATDPPIVLKVAPGDKIAVIQDGSSTGNCNMIEATH
jgi:hypothetical protein